ncbi:MAG: DUF4158 domain-containing protein, partial [Gammaproteobacteria bacterium]|nr:DUF4158 domain-containing protein [Gammaproteobacteria bacterium]
DDVDYLRRRYFDNRAVADLTVSDHTRKRHVETILGLFRYRLCALDERLLLEAHARQAARISGRPVYVLRVLVDLLRRQRGGLLQRHDPVRGTGRAATAGRLHLGGDPQSRLPSCLAAHQLLRPLPVP